MPHVTYTDPELAQAGLTEAEARARHGDRVKVLRWPFSGNDRAQAEGRTDGLVKIVTGPRGRILGAGIVGAGAGELIQPWVLALERGLKIGAMATPVLPYPTRGEAGRRAAVNYFQDFASNPLLRGVIWAGQQTEAMTDMTEGHSAAGWTGPPAGGFPARSSP